MTDLSPAEAEDFVRRCFLDGGLEPLAVEVRHYPEETIIVVRVSRELSDQASKLANDVDQQLAAKGFAGFVAVRPVDDAPRKSAGALKKGVFDARALDLANLLSARSRTSEAQPSLTYIRDAADSLSATVAR